MSGNDISTAIPISNNGTISDFIGDSNITDFWTFTLDQTSVLDVSLTDLFADADLSLYDSNGFEINASQNEGNTSEYISQDSLEAGTYYLEVWAFFGNTDYTLDVFSQPVNGDPGQIDDNDSFETATSISANDVIFDSVDYVSDVTDFWTFTLDQTSVLDVFLTDLFTDADLYLYDSNGIEIDFSTNGDNDSEDIYQESLEAGTYYVEVWAFSGNTDYTLNVFSEPVSDNTNNPTNLTLPSTIQEKLDNSNENDTYTFTIDNSGLFTLDLTNLSGDADVELYTSDDNYVNGSYNSDTQSEKIEIFLDSGDYYLNVYRYDNIYINYTLTVSAEGETTIPNDDNAGNNINEARDITVNSSEATYSDWVGEEDPNDFYRFVLSDAASINIELAGLSADADLSLLDDQGNSINSSFNGGTDNESIIAELVAGTYYVDVSFYQGSTNYELTISGTVQAPPDNPNSFSDITGYGFADAAAAVAKAINQTTFPDVANFGGNNDWNLNMVNAPEVWAQEYTGEGIVVAVLDTGVDRNHSDLSNNIWTNSGEIPDNGVDDDNNGYVDDVYGWNFVDNKKDTLDVDGHGTHVSGTIAGNNNGQGVTGIAYKAKIMPVKVLGDDGSGSTQGIARGIYYAVQNGANVINMSLGGGGPDDNLQTAIDYASNQGVVVVMAAGNESEPEPAYPARFAADRGVAIGAVNQQNNIADFSNLAGSDSKLVYVTNPGVAIYSSIPDNEYDSWDGTSMATPHVSGIVALMLQANPDLTDAEVRNILSSTTNNDIKASSGTFSIQSLKSSRPAKSFTITDDGTTVQPPSQSNEKFDTEIFRFQNTAQPGTYLFVGQQERQNILTNYPEFVEEGKAFNVAVQPDDDLLAINRFQNTAQPGTYLYAGPEESINIGANFPNFINEGTAFYVYPSSADKGIDLYRFQNSAQPGTYLFVGEQERQNILNNYPGFVEEGLAFEVFP